MAHRRVALSLAASLAASFVSLALATPAAAQAPTEIRVGATVAVTGPFSAEVGHFKKMMELWAETINAKGGIQLREYGKRLPIKMVVYDDTSKPPDAVRLYEKLVSEDQVHVLLGPYSSPITVAVSTVAEKHQIPMIALEANSTGIFKRGFKWLVGVIDDGTKWSHHYFDMLKAEGKAKSIGFVIEDTPHPKEVGSGSIPKAKSVGLEVKVEEYFPVATQDFTPIITKLKAANPDIVYLSAFPAREVTFFKQALEQGLSPREFHMIHHGVAFYGAVGIRNANLVTGEAYWMPGVKAGNSKPFEELLQKLNVKVEDYPWSSIHYFGFETLIAALEKAGTLDREKLLAAIKGLDIETISGRLKFDAQTGQGTLNPFPTQIQEGKYVTLWPAEIASGKHAYPRPGSQ
jgi:ABC-type branched-subunit amino acid transport system substrate-binding protein